MTLAATTTLNWLLAYNTKSVVEELWRARRTAAEFVTIARCGVTRKRRPKMAYQFAHRTADFYCAVVLMNARTLEVKRRIIGDDMETFPAELKAIGEARGEDDVVVALRVYTQDDGNIRITDEGAMGTVSRCGLDYDQENCVKIAAQALADLLVKGKPN
jgi:hypothetical protein